MAAKKKEHKAPQDKAAKPAPEQVVIALALAQALSAPRDKESYKLTIRHKEPDPWSLKVQNMRITPTKQYLN